MGAVSGQYGQVIAGSSWATECIHWSFNRSANTSRYASCSTAGYKKTVAGTKQGEGSIKGKYDPTNPIEVYLHEGSSVTLDLYTTPSKYYRVPAVIKDVKLEVDIDNGEVIGWDADFETDGAWTLPS